MTVKTDKKVIGRLIKVSKDGWGFISSKEIEFTRIFFHWTSLRQDTLGFKELKVGMLVEFTPIQTEGQGWRAMHIRIIEKPKFNHPKGIEEAEVTELNTNMEDRND